MKCYETGNSEWFRAKNERGEGREDRMNTERMSRGVGKQITHVEV